MAAKRFRWWHGLAFYAGVQAASWGLRLAARNYARQRGVDVETGDQRFYRSERLPLFAPPRIAFPIVWTINSVSTIAGALHALNLPMRSPSRNEFLWRQAGAWMLYSSFQPAYFGLRSPINAAVVTLFYTAATYASFKAAVRMRDPLAALSLVTTLGWLALANPVGITQAAWNRDPFWRIGPLINPPANWIKA